MKFTLHSSHITVQRLMFLLGIHEASPSNLGRQSGYNDNFSQLPHACGLVPQTAHRFSPPIFFRIHYQQLSYLTLHSECVQLENVVQEAKTHSVASVIMLTNIYSLPPQLCCNRQLVKETSAFILQICSWINGVVGTTAERRQTLRADPFHYCVQPKSIIALSDEYLMEHRMWLRDK